MDDLKASYGNATQRFVPSPSHPSAPSRIPIHDGLHASQVKFLRHNRHAELNAISQRFSIGVSIVSTPMSVPVSTDSNKGRENAVPPAAAADTAPAASSSSSSSASAAAVVETPAEQGPGGRSGTTDGPGSDGSARRTTTQEPAVPAENQGLGVGSASYAVLRGTAPMVTRARAMLLDRLKVGNGTQTPTAKRPKRLLLYVCKEAFSLARFPSRRSIVCVLERAFSFSSDERPRPMYKYMHAASA